MADEMQPASADRELAGSEGEHEAFDPRTVANTPSFPPAYGVTEDETEQDDDEDEPVGE